MARIVALFAVFALATAMTSLTASKTNTCSGTGVAITTEAECKSAVAINTATEWLEPSTNMLNKLSQGGWPKGCICRYPDSLPDCYFNPNSGNEIRDDYGVLCTVTSAPTAPTWSVATIKANGTAVADQKAGHDALYEYTADGTKLKDGHNITNVKVGANFVVAEAKFMASVASFANATGNNSLLTCSMKNRYNLLLGLDGKRGAGAQLGAKTPFIGCHARESVVQRDRCSDGEQNGNETGVDCGGSCTVCPVNCTFFETACTCTPACDETCTCTDNITITTPAAGRGKACPGGTNRNFTGAACPVLYTNLGSGVCSTGGKRMPYCQKHKITGCEAACSSDPKCIGYNPNTHRSLVGWPPTTSYYCFLFWTAGSPLTDTSWDSCNNAGQEGSMDGQDGTEGGTCFKKINTPAAA